MTLARDRGSSPDARPGPGPRRLTRPRPGAGAAVLVTVVAVLAALGAGELTAAVVSPASSPFLEVGQAAVRRTPEGLKELAIAWFGTGDKIALFAGMALVMALLAVGTGLLARSGPGPIVGLIVALGLVGGAAAVSAPTFGPLDLLAPAVALLAGLAAARGLHGIARRDVQPRPDGSGRRRLLVAAGGVTLGAGVAALAGRGWAAARGGDTDTVLPPPSAPAPLPVAGADFVDDGTPSWWTSAADFYRIDTARAVPRLAAATWSLRLHGMVDRELTLTYDQLRSRRLVEAPITLTCVSNDVGGSLISNGRWLGVPVADLLAEAGVRPGAQQVASTSSDGWTCTTPLAPLTDGRPALLALGLDGAPLPVEHGFPVRMVVPGLYGYVSACKWLTDLEVTTFDGVISYWEQRGWGRFGPIKTESRIDVPRAGTVPAGRTTVAGVAWAQHTGIAAVEVQVDDGPWRPAELATEPSVDSWRMWRLPAELAPGPHLLRVRATDRSGSVQTPADAPVLPDGATGWHTVTVTAV